MSRQAPPKWPGGTRCAVMLSFDVDGPTLWVDRSTGAWDDTRTFGLGGYGPWRGVPRILDLLRDREIPATFFLPGKTIEQWPALTERISADGHDIGHHGYLHELYYDLTPRQQEETIARCQELLRATTGRTAVGFRSPYGDITADTPTLLERLGFTYSSSLRGDDRPFRWVIDDRVTDLIEIPVYWELDDYHQFGFHDDPPRPAGLDRIAGTRATFADWQREFDGHHRFGLCYVLMMHPQVIGTPSRIRALGALIDHMRGLGDVWFATGMQIAGWWRTLEHTP